jgi:histidinol dehydrogenase
LKERKQSHENLPLPIVAAEKKMKSIIGRDIDFRRSDVQAVTRILNDVKRNGDSALIRYSRQFDAPRMTIEEMAITPDEIAAAAKQVDRAFMRALNRAASQIEHFHRQQLPKSWIDTRRSGTFLGQIVNPVDAAGVYVPGGTGGKTHWSPQCSWGHSCQNRRRTQGGDGHPAHGFGGGGPPSSRGGEKSRGGRRLQGGQRMGHWRPGLRYGTIPGVNVIVGPGNIFVTLAKKIVAGTVGIDMIAGPSEILVIADGTADPIFTAADLLSQAEHDPLASAILVTDSAELAQSVKAAVETQLESLAPCGYRPPKPGCFRRHHGCEHPDAAIDLANLIAPEHLELQVADPMAVAPRIRNAGAIFLGHYTPEPVGDYMAGPNHVLPTAGTARFSSALSVDHFMKKTSLIRYSPAAFRREARDIMCLANVEGLGAHANAIQVRLEKRGVRRKA